MDELILNRYFGNLTITNNQVISSSGFSISPLTGGKRSISSPGETKQFYYHSGRILFISILNSTGSIELTGSFSKNIKVSFYDRSNVKIRQSNNLEVDNLEIYHLKGGIDALYYATPADWKEMDKESVLALFVNESTIIRPRDVMKKFGTEKSAVNRLLSELVREKKLSVVRTSTGGDPQYQLGAGETKTLDDPLSDLDILDKMANLGEATAPELAKAILGNNLSASVSSINSKLYSLQRNGRVSSRRDPNEAYPLWSLL